MPRFNVLLATWFMGLFIAGSFQQTQSAPIDDLIAATKKEGTLEFFAAGTLSPEGAQRLGEAFNKKYQLNVKTVFHPSSGMARDVAKVITFVSAGLPSEWDVMLVTDAHHGTLWPRKVHQPFDYAKVGVNPKADSIR